MFGIPKQPCTTGDRLVVNRLLGKSSDQVNTHSSNLVVVVSNTTRAAAASGNVYAHVDIVGPDGIVVRPVERRRRGNVGVPKTVEKEKKERGGGGREGGGGGGKVYSGDNRAKKCSTNCCSQIQPNKTRTGGNNPVYKTTAGGYTYMGKDRLEENSRQHFRFAGRAETAEKLRSKCASIGSPALVARFHVARQR
ncbi:hypothetical protein WN55_08804 [Dufourea novaeangliae]|uniref:Uncharacterized protein n=1 Tax=Dufourea novaeangliae TaxID=178035 RepID=A0A154P004_DUFNO|nr:hypothetical protein WN55_08804 [Dufourea novaeangliae]